MTLDPIMTDAEIMLRPVLFLLTTGETVRCDPTSLASLDTAERSIIAAAQRMGIDGRVMFTAASRQLGDIVATRAHLEAAQ